MNNKIIPIAKDQEIQTHFSYGLLKGIFNISDVLLKSICKQFYFINYGLVEKKTDFYKLMFDFDFKEKHKYYHLYSHISNEIVNHLIDIINQTLLLVFVTPDLHYIYCDKNIGKGIHLYYPNIIVTQQIHSYIFNLSFNKIVELDLFKLEHSRDCWYDIFDDCVFKNVGLRLPYFTVNGGYYKFNEFKSTYNIFILNDFDNDDKYEIIKNCSIRTILLKHTDINDNINIVANLKAKDVKKVIPAKKVIDAEEANIVPINIINSIPNIPIIKPINISINIIELTKILDCFPDSYFETYNRWNVMGFHIFNTNNSEDACKLFHKRSKVGKYIDIAYEEIYKKFYSYKISDSYKPNILRHIARKINRDVFDTITLNIPYDVFLYQSVKFNNPKIVNISNDVTNIPTFMEPIIQQFNNAENKFKFLMLKSGYGTGKTKMLQSICESGLYNRILFITHRRTLVLDLLRTFELMGFVSYLNKTKFNAKGDKLIVNLDSLHLLKEDYDILNDECSITLTCTDPSPLPIACPDPSPLPIACPDPSPLPIACPDPLPRPIAYPDPLPVKKYNLIIIDETCSVLNHFESPLMKNKAEIFTIFDKLILTCGKVICCDGDMSNREVEFIKSYDKDVVLYVNEFIPIKHDYFFHHDEYTFVEYIEEDLKYKKKVVIVSMSASFCYKLEERYKGTYNTLCITGNSDEKTKRCLIDIEQIIIKSKIQLFIYSPSITVGVDISMLNYFNRIYGYMCSNSVNARDFCQMLYRVRNPTCVLINVLLDRTLSRSLIANYYDIDEVKSMSKDIYKNYGYNENSLSTFAKIRAWNKFENINSENYLLPVFIQYIIKKGNSYTILPQSTKTIFDKLVVESIINAANIDNHKYESLLNNQTNDVLNKDQKLSIEKYLYAKIFKVDVEDINGSFMFTHYGKKHIVRNNKKFLGIFNNNDININNYNHNHNHMANNIIIEPIIIPQNVIINNIIDNNNVINGNNIIDNNNNNNVINGNNIIDNNNNIINGNNIIDNNNIINGNNIIDNNNNIINGNNIIDNNIIDITDDKTNRCKMAYIKHLLYFLGFNALDKSVDKKDFEDKYKIINTVIDNKFRLLFNMKKEEIYNLMKINDTNKKILGFLNSLIEDYGVIIRGTKKQKYNKNTKKREILWKYKLKLLNIISIMQT